MKRISFDGKTFRVTNTAPNGLVNDKTIFYFQHIGNLITATYKGGRVKTGFLIGKLHEGKLEFQYSQMHDDESLNGGYSVCEIQFTEDGRIKLVEHFEWSDGQKGTNILEELE